MGPYHKSPDIWYEESAIIYSPFDKVKEDSYTELDYIWINYKGVDWRINPIFIQIAVTNK